MYEPKFTITNKLLQEIVETEKTVTLITHSDISAQQLLKLKSTSKTYNLFHLAHMLNTDLSLKDAQRITEGKLYDQDNKTSIILSNLRNVLEFTRTTLQDDYRDLDASMLLHMNKNLLANWKEVWDVKFRNPEIVEDTEWNDWVRLIDKTVEPLTLQDELKAAFDWYKITSPSLHPLIRIPVLLFRLVQLSPFSHGNKFTIICGMDFLLLKLKYLGNDVLPVFRLFDLNNNLYISTIESLSQNPNQDITYWIETFNRSLADELKKLQHEIDVEIVEGSRNQNTFLDLNNRQLKILKYLQTIPTVKREDYVQMMDVSTMTAFRDLNSLVTKKLIKIQGRGRATKYMLTNR